LWYVSLDAPFNLDYVLYRSRRTDLEGRYVSPE
jgi:hypothetical protein